MNGRQARGCGISDQETTNTTAKNAANSIVGKLTKAPRPTAEAFSDGPHDSQAHAVDNSLGPLGRRRTPAGRVRRRRAARKLRRGGPLRLPKAALQAPHHT